ncbi:3-deoxy-D-manno-octulosonic acid transferase [Roseibacillus persicicus]|uniref:3-deoxy-D-manno-octulosonic acid transferase n=1 Tax=Roseibacillus persicicus TaxID=454148 RepID=UPI00280F3FC0|nr:glycosyltransferase N-terminal domain-containing protein [Roseibacillus persicicus]MDQ8192606.1 glycosyltransferase N-terminal domain-containing protein [Roseibacillus persicicus]
MLRHFYNFTLIPLAIGASPFWILKTKRRGGLSKRLWEKLGRYKEVGLAAERKVRPIYVHAASVGEANIARKLITRWSTRYPEERFLLGIGTSTGFDLARQSPPANTEVIYAPLDLSFVVTSFFAAFRPKLVVLIEHEVWPNMIHYARERSIPVALVNARLSLRSGKRLAKLRPLLGKMYQGLSWVGAQSDEDCPRLEAIGIRQESLVVSGSVKFDPALDTPSASDFNPSKLLESLGEGPILMALSTHPGEELLFAKAASQVRDARLVMIPRHMERRDEIQEELSAAGFKVVLRSTMNLVDGSSARGKILVVDTTGEMPAFTKEAQVVFVGKTLLSKGGQNPCEAISASVPVVAGPWFGNFEPLATQLRNCEGLWTIEDEKSLESALQTLSESEERASKQAKNALSTLEAHRGATDRTVEALAKLLEEE